MKDELVNKLFKLSLGVFIFVVFVLLFEAWYFLKLKNKNLSDLFFWQSETPELTGSPEEELPEGELEQEVETELSNLEIAEQVLTWLEGQREENGVYLYNWSCSQPNECESTTDNRVGIYAIWGRYKYLEKIQDEKNVKIINQDLEIYTDENKIPVIQNNFWNCKLMHEMWQSELFSSEQKLKIKEICQRGGYQPSGLREINAKIESEESVEFNSQKAVDYEVVFDDLSNKEGDLSRDAAYSSDFIAKFLWENNELDLQRGKLYFKKVVDLYTEELENGKYFSPGTTCTLGISSIDIYQATGEEDYLNFSENLIKKLDLFSEFSLRDNTICGLYAKALYRETNNPEYLEFKDKIIDELISAALDYPGYEGYFAGDGSFHSLFTTKVNKPIQENSLIIGLLLD